jgi:hypothetical protein
VWRSQLGCGRIRPWCLYFADRLKIRIIQRRLRAFVQSRGWSLDSGVIGSCERIPCHAKTVDVQVAVSGGHLELSLFGVWIVRLETRQEVGVDLLAQGMIWGHLLRDIPELQECKRTTDTS